jgi:hypothetical protein
MRIESSVTAVSWLPSEAVRGLRRLPFALGAARYDDPPPDRLDDAAALARSGAVRQVNELAAWIEVEDGTIRDSGYAGGGYAGVIELGVGEGTIHGEAAVMPLLRKPPAIEDGAARFVQTFGGRTGPPVPRRIAGLPIVRVAPPLAWTTLSLTIAADGSAEGSLSGGSAFPRHWVYDAEGRLVAKSAEIDFASWLEQAGSGETPWGDQADGILVAPAESELERALSAEIMKRQPRVRTLEAGEFLTTQGAAGSEAFLVLDGILDVSVGGQEVAEVGPGSIVGERAVDEGRRTASMQARTTCRVVPFDPATLSTETREELASRHRAEEL